MPPMQYAKTIFLFFIVFYFSPLISIAQIQVETNFEGGNGRLVTTGANNYVQIEAEFKGSDTRNITYFCKIINLNPTQHLQLEAITEFTGNYTFYSYDAENWLRSTPKVNDIFTVPLQGDEIYVAHFPPYLYSRISTYLQQLKNTSKDYYQIFNLATSESGNPVEALRITDPCVDDTDKKLVWILGRMHAFEHPAN